MCFQHTIHLIFFPAGKKPAAADKKAAAMTYMLKNLKYQSNTY